MPFRLQETVCLWIDSNSFYLTENMNQLLVVESRLIESDKNRKRKGERRFIMERDGLR
jgi:hypothetical protein